MITQGFSFLRQAPYRKQLGWMCGLALVAVAALLPLFAQPSTAPVATARAAAERALLAGKYDEIEQIAQPFPNDEQLVVSRAKALIARGEYARAEALLKAPASEAPTGDAALEYGLLQQYLGRRTEARRAFQLLLLSEARSATARDYLRAARAARGLGRFEEANSLFREADSLSPNDPAVNTAWGELFLEKYAPGDAARSFQVALKSNPDYGPAQLGMAKAVANENPPAAHRYVKRALELNPNDVAAHLYEADLAIDDDKRDAAREAIAKAQAINPNSLEAYALKAAIGYVDGKDSEFKEALAAALKIHPTYGEAYRVVGAVTARQYRFDDAVEHVRRAISVDRENVRAQADLGAHLMRTGDERGARRALETAFRADSYDLITFNLLDLLDKIDNFESIREGEMVIKLHPEEVGVMREYVPVLAKEALETLSKRWDFTPTGPILIEMFPVHDDFAVRNVGLPGLIGALGACFGRVVSLDSPRARDPGTFNWGATLWHEMAHVITLQLSNQRIPRWLTEGISVFEEKRGRPEWGREMELPFARAMEAGQVLKLRDLNAGFQNPQTISLAYYEASLLVEHIVQKHGEPMLRALVKSFADGIDTETAIRKVLSSDIDALQGSFDTFLTARFSTLRAALDVPKGFDPDAPLDKLKEIAAGNPGSYPVQVTLGRALRKVDPAAATQAFQRAIALAPMITGPESAYVQIVEMAMASNNKEQAAQALEGMTAVDHTDVESARQLLTLIDPKDGARRRVALQRIVAIDPFDSAAHTELGRLALASKQTPEAVRAFRVALAAGPVDRAGAHADLAEGLHQSGDNAEAKRHVMSALEIAPTYQRAQDLLLKLIEGR
jgi:tetratricopeptide (TPR) repeat protein